MQSSAKAETKLPSLVIPSRPSIPSKPTGRKVPLLTNFFAMKLKTANYIYVYDVKFSENIPLNNTPLRKSIIRCLHVELEKLFSCYLFTGSVLYTPTDKGTTPVTTAYENGELKGNVVFNRVHEISVQDILNPQGQPAKAQTVNSFLNIMVKCLLSACNMCPVGRTGKYLLPTAAKQLPDYKIEVWPGYHTSVGIYESGLLLEVDYASRILRNETVYDFMKMKMQSMGSDYRDGVKEIVVGNSVLARYGNKRTYVINDVDYTHSPATCEFEGPQGKMSIAEYFLKKYLLKIKDPNQPLLVSQLKQKDGKKQQIYLVPELCSLTGLPGELREDRNAMKQLATYTKLSPDQRSQQAQKLLQQFSQAVMKNKKSTTTDKAKELMDQWNLQIDFAPREIKGRLLDQQEIFLAGGKITMANDNGQLNFKEEIAVPLQLDKWILVHTGNDKSIAESFVETMYKASRTFGIDIGYPTYAETKGIKAKDFIEAFQTAATKIQPQMAVFILPPPTANEYSQLKKFAVSRNPPVLTQMVRSKTITGGKSLMAICSKISLQINAKRSGDLWRVKTPSIIPKKTMVIGVDIAKEAGSTCLGFASSYDPNFSQYYTQVMFLEGKQDVCSAMGILFVKSLEFFIKKTKKFLPELIVIYRDGVSDSLRQALLVTEVQNMLNAVRLKFADYTPKILYATINKKIHARFFMKPGAESRGLSNPRPGTIVDTDIVNQGKYEFYLMPQFVNEGTGTPSKYQVLYDNSGLGIDIVEELSNALCYGYYNWQGAIRTPAPCKYAFAHARLVAKYTKTLPIDQMLAFPYYL